MYQIIGIQRNQKQRLMATPPSAREARTHYHASHKLFQTVMIIDPSGSQINLGELNRIAEEEERLENKS